MYWFAIRGAWCRKLRDFGRDRVLTSVVLVIVVAMALVRSASADQRSSSRQDADRRQRVVSGVLKRYCVGCHGADVQEAGVRLDTLDFARGDAVQGASLEKILRVLRSEKMPPEGEETPTAEERAKLVSRLTDRLNQLAEEVRRSRRGTRNRRLTVEEYNFTMLALFGVDAEFADLLPEDPISESGYRNNSERLGLSSIQIETYLDSARRSVGRYVQFGKLDQRPIRYHIELEDLFYSTADRYATRNRAPEAVDPDVFAARRKANLASPPKYVDALGPKLPGAHSDDEALRAAIPKLNQQFVAIPQRLSVGEMIVRIRAGGTADRDGRFPRMRVEAGITLGDGCSIDKRVLGETDVTAPLNEPKTYEFRIRLEDVPTKGPLNEKESFDRLSVFDMDQIFISNVSCDPKAIFALGRGGYSDPATGSKRIAGQLKQMADDRVGLLHLDCLEIEMLPGVGAENGPYRWRLPIEEAGLGPQAELKIVQDFLAKFMRHAYRRPVAAKEVVTKLALFRTLRGRDFTFEESLRETLAAVLISPSFLFLESSPPAGETRQLESPTPYQLAARLSYLLWLSPPDEQLMKHAMDGSLKKRSVLRSEAERLLADPRSRHFLESFCRQWLRLDKYENVAVNRQIYPTYDADFADLSLRETLAYFTHVFESDASALDLIDSDYAILNDRLSEHYGVGTVTAGTLHEVQLPKNSVRGGLLTQASLLTMNSDGIDSHPIRRGVWLLDRILNSPPPPPPPNVPEIDESDPDFRGLSLKEQIALHRESGACKNCHAKIDPWGIPFENFDATGRWREKAKVGDRLRDVDAEAVLPGGQQITGIAELKEYVREQQGEQFTNALVHHMLTYAIGRPPDFADREQVTKIQKRFAASEYRMKELVLAIIESQWFRE